MLRAEPADGGLPAQPRLPQLRREGPVCSLDRPDVRGKDRLPADVEWGKMVALRLPAVLAVRGWHSCSPRVALLHPRVGLPRHVATQKHAQGLQL